MRTQWIAAAAIAISAISQQGFAQTKARAFIVVTARDSTGSPVTGAELTVRRGLKDIAAQGVTDDNGRGLLTVETNDSTDLQVTMRKIGYNRGDRFFGVGPMDTARVAITVGRTKSALAPMKITAKAKSDPWNSYDLSADEIENSDRPLDNAFEVVKKLRPVMLTSRGGCATGIQEVWVNGKRVRLPLRPFQSVAQRAAAGAPVRARYSYIAVAALSEIAPEHIQEIHYHDCFDHTLALAGSLDAVFITLKPGVDYVQNVGSFVVETTSDKANTKR